MEYEFASAFERCLGTVVLRLSEEPRAKVGEIDLPGPTAPFICSVAEEEL